MEVYENTEPQTSEYGRVHVRAQYCNLHPERLPVKKQVPPIKMRFHQLDGTPKITEHCNTTYILKTHYNTI